jgi:hypothetical protein
MKYRIKYNYDTGDSFSNSPDNSDFLEMVWENIEVAKQNLQRIKDHYSQYRDCNSYSYSKNKAEIFESNKDKDWFVKNPKIFAFEKDTPSYYWSVYKENVKYCEENGLEIRYGFDESEAENCIILYTDDGKPWQFWTPWCVYFETLNYAEIVPEKEEYDGMKIRF